MNLSMRFCRSCTAAGADYLRPTVREVAYHVVHQAMRRARRDVFRSRVHAQSGRPALAAAALLDALDEFLIAARARACARLDSARVLLADATRKAEALNHLGGMP